MNTHLSSFLREKRGALSRDALAEKARALSPGVKGLLRTNIERWEAGDSEPRRVQLNALFRALDVDEEARLDLLRKGMEAGTGA